LNTYDPPTNTEFEARSLVSADYTVVSDLGAVQTGDSYAIVNGDHGLVSIQDDVDAILVDTNDLQTNQGNWLTATGFAVAGDEMGLADDAITSAKFDETTAFPLKSEDSGSTEVARTGADSDTLETLSDQIDTIPSPTIIQVDSDIIKVYDS